MSSTREPAVATSVYLSRLAAEQIRALADRETISMTAWIRRALAKELAAADRQAEKQRGAP